MYLSGSLLEVFCPIYSEMGFRGGLYAVFKWLPLLFKWKLDEMYNVFREGRVIP